MIDLTDKEIESRIAFFRVQVPVENYVEALATEIDGRPVKVIEDRFSEPYHKPLNNGSWYMRRYVKLGIEGSKDLFEISNEVVIDDPIEVVRISSN